MPIVLQIGSEEYQKELEVMPHGKLKEMPKTTIEDIAEVVVQEILEVMAKEMAEAMPKEMVVPVIHLHQVHHLIQDIEMLK
jgi:hypothetical protein